MPLLVRLLDDDLDEQPLDFALFDEPLFALRLDALEERELRVLVWAMGKPPCGLFPPLHGAYFASTRAVGRKSRRWQNCLQIHRSDQ